MRYALFDENVDAYPPTLGSEFAGCYDIRTPYRTEIQPGQVGLVRTNLVLEIPVGMRGVICPRSSIAKTRLRLANSIGIIDSDYRGELMFAYENTGKISYVIEPGEKIGQMYFEKVLYFDFHLVDRRELIATNRGEGGFGSTGK